MTVYLSPLQLGDNNIVKDNANIEIFLLQDIFVHEMIITAKGIIAL